MKKAFAVTAIVALSLSGAAVLGPLSASAHIPGITADCDNGVHVTGTSYDDSKVNTWDINIGGTDHSGTFGSSVDVTFPVPQLGATTHVTANITDADNTPAYTENLDTNIGPCGKAAPHDVTILPVTTNFDCTTGTTYTVPVQPDQVKYALDPVTGIRPVPGTFPLVAGATIDVQAHVAAVYLRANGGDYNPADYDSGVLTGASTNTMDCHPPQQCVVTGSTDTEAGDLAPIQGQFGLDFDGPTAAGQAMDIYARVSSGNAQGITGKSITFAGTSTGFPAQAVIEIWRNGITGADFATLSTNFSAAEAAGTINLDTYGGWYTSKIASGPGSLAWVSTGNTETYAQLVANYPSNTLASALSLHLQTNSPANAHSTVSAVSSSCSSYNLVPSPPNTTHRVTDINGPVVCNTDTTVGGGSYTEVITHFTTAPVWNNTTHAYDLVETTDAGYPQNVPHTTIATLESCPIHSTVVDPTVPSVNCGINESAVLPDSTVAITYSFSSSTLTGATVLATPAANNVVIDAIAGWTDNHDGTFSKALVYDAVKACIVPTQLLAITGGDETPWLIGGASLFGAGFVLVMIAGALVIRRRRLEQE